jgi:hypothetical protein
MMFAHWLNYLSLLVFPMFFGIGEGPSSGEIGQFNATAGIGNFGTTQGEEATATANNFWESILSGDPGKISQVLGPQESAINKQGQQQKKTLSEFGNRSGGTNAQAQSIDDTTRSSINDLISRLTGGAASALGASGESLLSTGLSAHTAAFSEADTIHQQRSAQLNDIFKSIAGFLPSFIPSGGGSTPSYAAPSGMPGYTAPGSLDAPFDPFNLPSGSFAPLSS